MPAVPLKIDRVFVPITDHDPLDSIETEQRKAVIKDSDGTIIFERDDVTMPKSWAQLPTDIMVSKYFRKAGVPDTGSETSAVQVVRRVVDGITKYGRKIRGLFAAQDAVDAFRDELSYMLINQIAAFNSPCWFNVGLSESYGIKGESIGSWHYDDVSNAVVKCDDAYSSPAASACFILSIKDDLMDIADAVKREMSIFKQGGGSGTNVSALRAEGEPLSGGGTSSGMMSFLGIFDAAASATKSGGITRRAARLLCLDADHPDIVDFIRWKAREEDKAKLLLKAGYSGSMDGEAYKTIGGQNANNSVRVTDEFMRAVESGSRWETRWRTTGKVAKSYTASEIMDEIAVASWRCGDPGLQFHTTINEWHTCPSSGPIVSSNPCTEVTYIDNCACNLASINLVKFLKKDGNFDTDKFKHACRILIIAQEILVDYASYPTKEIAQNSHDHRILGLGYANLGSLLMRMGLPYDSDAGRDACSFITSLMTASAYITSAELAGAVGPFAEFRRNRESMLNIIKKHMRHSEHIESFGYKDTLGEAWEEALNLGEKNGYRNAQTSALAPTGTIGLLMGCDTTGIEPEFALIKQKKLAGGGMLRMVNHAVPSALTKLGYSDAEIGAIVKHLDRTEGMSGAPYLKTEHMPVFDCAIKCGDGEAYINPMGHLKMVAAAQPFISMSISKTVNVPSDATVEDIRKIHIDAWKMGVKSISIYRDGCKEFQPLSTTKKEVGAQRPGNPPIHAKRYRLPTKRGGFTQEARIGEHKLYVRTGEYTDGSLGEVFLDMHKQGGALSGMLSSFAIAVSIALQHGVPLERFVDTFVFSKFEPYGPVDHARVKNCTSVVDFIFRMLGVDYLNMDELAHVKEEDSGKKTTESKPKRSVRDSKFCNVCGHLATRSGTCHKCDNCGTSLGCS